VDCLGRSPRSRLASLNALALDSGRLVVVIGRNWWKCASQLGIYCSQVEMESEAKVLQAIFDHAALGIAQISLDGSWLRVNNRYCEMLGYSESELLTRKIWDITRPPDYDEVSRGRRQLLEGAISSHTMEKRFVRKDGTVFWGRLNRSLVRDQDHQPQYFIAVVEDITEKVNAELALRDSEQRLTLAQNAAHLGVCQWDLSANVLTYSEEYARLYGQSPQDPPLTLDDLPKRTHPDDRERVQASIRDALERTHAWDTEYRVLWPDGSVHWLHSKGAVLLDASGRPVRSTGVILDITEGKRAEAALHQRELQYRDLFEHMNEGIAYCKMLFENGIGSDFIYLAVNPRFEALTGLRDVIGKRASEVLPLFRDLDPGAFEVYGRVAQTGVPVRFERFLNVFQQWFAMSAYSPERGFVCLIFDVITERKRIEEELREREHEVSMVMDHTPDGIMRLDRQLRVTYVNARTVSSTGIPAEALIGRTMRELGLSQFELAESAALSAIETGQPSRIEFSYPGPGGITEWEAQLIPEFAPKGSVASILIIARELTERKRLERIAEANRKEIQALAARLMTAQEDERRRVSRELHDGMCQELGSLAIEIGNIAAHLPSREDVPSQLRALQDRLVKASLEARNIAYQLRPPGLDELGLPIVLRDLCNQFAERAPEMALEFTSGALPESVPLEVTSCVYRVAQESLYNTVKHSRAKHASVILTWRQGAIELTVADDGDGFDCQSVQGKGGLGLIGMEERARLVNGKLTITSQPGSGTRIALDVALPLAAH
jgi:PAS domain S-box-containing protein